MDIVTRSVVFLVGWSTALALSALAVDPADDAPIGFGLAAFALVFLGAVTWAFLDGRRRGTRWVARVWIVVALVLGLFVPFATAVTDGGFDLDVVLADLLGTLPFMLALVAVPAVLAGVVGANAPGGVRAP